MKNYVSALCKNVSKFAARFMKSVSDADGVFVMDTGSTDDSVKVLKKLGATVNTQVINPFRFDTARNLGLNYVPDDGDLYFCRDLDEVADTGWRKRSEQAAEKAPEATRFMYRYVWSKYSDGSDGTVFGADEIHKKA